MRTAVFVMLSFLLTTLTGLADKIKSEFDKAAHFSQFKTYAFKPGLLMLADKDNVLDSHFLNAFRNELNAKGMTEVKENPDVYVTYFGTLGAGSASGSLYAPGQQARYDWGIPQGWSGISSTTAIEGSLLIEMVNASTNQLAWRATCQGLIKNLGKPEKQGERIREVVQKAFQNYPPKTRK